MIQDHKHSALVVLSGGQDSTTCLYWAIARWGRELVHAVTFDYGQRHRVEIDAAHQIVELSGIASHTVLPIDTFAALGGNALTSNLPPENGMRADTDSTLPNTFVPGRNLIFLTLAAALAYQKDISHLVTGVAQTDYSGYPDCRDNTLKALELAICLGMDSSIKIHTPLMFLSKAQTVDLAQEVGAMAALAFSHTCYNGQVPPCGQCAACILRANGFAQAGVLDPLLVRLQGGV